MWLTVSQSSSCYLLPFFFFYWVGGGGERGEGRQGEGLGDNRDWNILPHFIQVINETRNLRVFF